MIQLLPEQAEGLRELQSLCREIGTDIVVIGAVAYRAWVRDEDRMTEDIDVVVALDIDELPRLTKVLSDRGWRQDAKREHRWYTTAGARLDLLPVGQKARQEKHLTWPVAETTMSLVGYDHVFNDAVECDLGAGLRARIIPVAVLGLLKIISYMDNPYIREKDLQDLASIMDKYEEAGERRFSDEVLDARVDYDSAGAFLLGRDLSRLCNEEDEREIVDRFLNQLRDSHHPTFNLMVRLVTRRGERSAEKLRKQIAELSRGFEGH